MGHTLHSLLQYVGLDIDEGLPNPEISTLTFDSRDVKEGSLFIGLPGENIDGGVFWSNAIASGSVAAIIGFEAAQVKPPSKEDVVVILNHSISTWAGKLAAAFWGNPSSKLKLIGVTGTNGKTTTTYLIEHLSSSIGISTGLFGTLVNRWPSYSQESTHTTLSAEKLQYQLANAAKAGVELVSMEVSSHALHQQRVAGCIFSGAVFTNLTQDHLDYHSSMEAYFKAKSLLFRSPLLQSSKYRAVINVDDFWGKQLANEMEGYCWRCSLNKDALMASNIDLTINNLETTSKGIKGRLYSPCGEGEFITSLIGKFNLMNLLQAVGVLLQQGFSLEKILNHVGTFSGVPGRMERLEVGSEQDFSRLPLVLVDYAHTPDGLQNALIASRSLNKGRLICVFGCGGDRDRGKRSKMGAIASKLADYLILTSDNPRNEDPSQIIEDILLGIPSNKNLVVKLDRFVAIKNAILEAEENDIVLIAGKGHENYQIIGSETIDFDDREVAKDILSNLLEN